MKDFPTKCVGLSLTNPGPHTATECRAERGTRCRRAPGLKPHEHLTQRAEDARHPLLRVSCSRCRRRACSARASGSSASCSRSNTSSSTTTTTTTSTSTTTACLAGCISNRCCAINHSTEVPDVVPELYETAEEVGNLLVRPGQLDFAQTGVSGLGLRAHLHSPTGKVNRSTEANSVIFGVHESIVAKRRLIAMHEIMPTPVDGFAIRRLDWGKCVLVMLDNGLFQILEVDKRNQELNIFKVPMRRIIL
mmetsp:Transcript_95704/g.310092  ORF Transcript_95704/g.310092 Transcript_95704/m.310092 type:complete len:249 (-) Transcript_95704:898-1644(-)